MRMNKEKQCIVSFIKALSEEKYAEANKYLKEAVQQKLLNKMNQYKQFTL